MDNEELLYLLTDLFADSHTKKEIMIRISSKVGHGKEVIDIITKRIEDTLKTRDRYIDELEKEIKKHIGINSEHQKS